MEPEKHTFDVVIIGGGPAGAATGILLARQGYRTAILEKDHHPRFHIGESLLPLSLPYLEELGILEAVDGIGLRKYAAEFHSPYHGRMMEFPFRDATRNDYPYAYEVRRSEFDELLFRQAGRCGAELHEGLRVDGLVRENAHIEAVLGRDARGQPHEFHARFFIDASGRDTVVAEALGSKRTNSRHRSAALFAHYAGAERQAGEAEGNIAIHWFDHGWFWIIPLRDGTTSVGAVCQPDYLKNRKTSVEEFFSATIQLAPGVADCLANAQRLSSVSATGNYSYASTKMTGNNFLLVGDAYAFIDPVFSSGVHLALSGAFKAAKTVDTALSQPGLRRRALKAYESEIRQGLNHFAWFIYRIRTPAIRDLFMNPRNLLRMRQGIISVLAGDLFRGTRLTLPLFAFRCVYHIKTLLMQWGLIRTVSP